MNYSESSVIQDIFAITSQCLIQGHLPTDKEQLMTLFKKVKATKEEIIRLAKDNKLRWLRDAHCRQNEEEFRKNMNIALATYLSQ